MRIIDTLVIIVLCSLTWIILSVLVSIKRGIKKHNTKEIVKDILEFKQKEDK